MAETGQANPSESCKGVLSSECTGFAGLGTKKSMSLSVDLSVPLCQNLEDFCALVIVMCTCWACLTVDEGFHPEFENRRCFFRNHPTKETGPVHSPDGDAPPAVSSTPGLPTGSTADDTTACH